MEMFYIAGIVPEEDGSGYSVYFPDVPQVAAGGETVQEAMDGAVSCKAGTVAVLRQAPLMLPVRK